MQDREKMKKPQTIVAVILILVFLLACLGFLGYFGAKTVHQSHLRTEARKAFAAEEWKTAEKLLNEYIGLDPDSEEDLVRLAKVYKHFGNTGEEMQCWYKASTLNPLNPEYWDNYTECAMNARDFGHLYSTLNRKTVLGWEPAPKDKMLYLICAVRTSRIAEAKQFYARMRRDNEEKKLKLDIFHQDDLARFAEFLVTNHTLTPVERSSFINDGIKSDDPFVRLESILLHLVDLELSGGDIKNIREQEETMLKQALELNRYTVTPILANVYFSELKFATVIELAEPYLANIDNIPLSVIFAESCVYNNQPEKLKPLAGKFRTFGLKYKLLASYFDALYDFSQGVEKNDDLARHMQETNGIIRTNLVNLIDLQISLNSDNLEKILESFESIMKNPPFYNLQERARSAVRHYLGTKLVEKPELYEDSRIIRIAQLASICDEPDPFLMRIMIADQRKRNVLTQQIIQDNLDVFPFDPYLLETAAEYELFNDDPEKCLEYVERFYELKDEKRSITFDLLHILALERLGKIDEATMDYTALVENNEMNRNILYRYLKFCIGYKRGKELTAMADLLDASDVPDLKSLAPFFRAESLLLQEKKDEALSLLKTAKTDNPDFAFHAATLFSTYDVLDEALSRYLALLDTHPERLVILADIAEVYYSKGMRSEALAYAKQAWETNQDNRVGQFVYAKMLAANGRYQDTEKILRIPRRKIKLPDEVRILWTDIMYHVIENSMEGRQFLQAEDLLKHLLIVLPDDEFGKETMEKVRELLKTNKDKPRTENVSAVPAA